MTTISTAGETRSELTWGQVYSVVRPWRWVLAGAGLSVLAGAGLDLVPPFVIRRVVDEHLRLGRLEGLLGLAATYLGAMAAVQVLGFVTAYLTAYAAQAALSRLRVRLFAHLQKLPLAYFDRTPLGDVISRCTSDMDTLDALFSSGVVDVVAQLLRLGTTFVAMVALSPILATVMVLVVPPLYAITRFFQVRMRDAERATRRAVGMLNARLQESLARVEVIRAFGREPFFVRRFREALRATVRASNRSVGYGSVYSPTMNILSSVVIALLFLTGTTPLLATAGISLGTLTAFVLLFQQFFKPIISIGNDWQTVQSALAGAERVFQVLSLPTDETLASPALSPSEARILEPRVSSGESAADGLPAIQIAGVSFGYFPDQPVLSHLTLSVRPGQHLAVVGRTGAGKSTLVHLLGGLYHPWSGVIRVAARDPFAMPADERRRILGPVPQRVRLFSGTVVENLTLGDAQVPREDVERAARMAETDAFIRTLPQGYDTYLTDLSRGGGVQLSAGQRQLLALARALVWRPQILLLDEATASVDNATEAAFRSALDAHLHDRGGAILTVAHRLSTAIEADYVVVMDDGCIVEEGTPQALLGGGGRLAALWELERAGWDWRKREGL